MNEKAFLCKAAIANLNFKLWAYLEVICLVGWGRAWKGALALLGWSILWGLAGIAIIIVGIVIIFGTLMNTLFSFYYSFSFPWGGIIIGIILIIAGGLITYLGTLASFFKIDSEIVSEEVKRRLNASKPAVCPACGGQLKFIEQFQRWYCEKEAKYV